MSRKEKKTMNEFWKYIKAASIVIGVGVVALFVATVYLQA